MGAMTPRSLDSSKPDESYMLGDISGVDTTVGDFDVDRLSTASGLPLSPGVGEEIATQQKKPSQKKRKLRKRDDQTELSSEKMKDNLKDPSDLTVSQWFSFAALRPARFS